MNQVAVQWINEVTLFITHFWTARADPQLGCLTPGWWWQSSAPWHTPPPAAQTAAGPPHCSPRSSRTCRRTDPGHRQCHWDTAHWTSCHQSRHGTVDTEPQCQHRSCNKSLSWKYLNLSVMIEILPSVRLVVTCERCQWHILSSINWKVFASLSKAGGKPKVSFSPFIIFIGLRHGTWLRSSKCWLRRRLSVVSWSTSWAWWWSLWWRWSWSEGSSCCCSFLPPFTRLSIEIFF